ncbi:MAG TPA: hypothetical protein DCG34_08850 [Clostridiales bacterium]|jgi:hypothetical protein|nr:hypothetical protein [Clostridiales bacterium]
MTNNKEWFSTVPDGIDDPKNKYRIIYQDETVFSLSLKDLLDRLETTQEFYKEPTKETMDKILSRFLFEQIDVFRQDYNFYREKIIPVFLKDEIKPEWKK